jgi:hypothetical protein
MTKRGAKPGARPSVNAAQSSNITPAAPALTIKKTITYVQLKAVEKNIAQIRAQMRMAMKGEHEFLLALPAFDDSPECRLELTVNKQACFARRKSADTPIVHRSPPTSENMKVLAQQAMQSDHVKLAFEVAFPSGEVMAKALDALCDTLATKKSRHRSPNKGIDANKRDRLIKLLKSRPPQQAARALDALWACMANTQRKFHLEDANYDELCAYFSRLRAMMTSTPPQLAEIPEFKELYSRVHGAESVAVTAPAAADGAAAPAN